MQNIKIGPRHFLSEKNKLLCNIILVEHEREKIKRIRIYHHFLHNSSGMIEFLNENTTFMIRKEIFRNHKIQCQKATLLVFHEILPPFIKFRHGNTVIRHSTTNT